MTGRLQRRRGQVLLSLRWYRAFVAIVGCCFAQPAAAQTPVAAANVVSPDDIVVTGDEINAPLTSTPASSERGRSIVLDRAVGNCLICHHVPVPSEPFQGTVGPDLSGVGERLTIAQLRLRLVDQSRLSAATLMPPFYRTTSLTRVDPRYRDKPVLSALQIEDVVAYLSSLRE